MSGAATEVFPQPITPASHSAIAEAAYGSMIELRQHMDAVMANMIPMMRSEDPKDRPEYWIGRLEGTIITLLAVLPEDDS